MNRLPGILIRAGLLVIAALAMSVLSPAMPGAADLVLVVIASTALMRGPWAGALMGLGGGWLIDLIPPGSEPLGASALTYLAVGVLLGASRRVMATSPLALPVLPLGAIAAASLTLLSVRAVSAAAGFGTVVFADLAWTWLLTVLAALVLIVPLVWLDRWLTVHRWG
ncbi:MAG: rod shape-determining protein MreD [Ornithinimicrobium sp.]